MRRKLRLLPLPVLFMLSVGVTVVHTCGVEFTFRAYLDRRFWQPFAQYASELTKYLPPLADTPHPPFAGISGDETKGVMQALRVAYRPLSAPLFSVPPGMSGPPCPQCEQARQAVMQALRVELTDEEREEVQLVDAKIDMREGETGNQESLLRAREKLQVFVRTARTPRLLSEARGWLARVHYRLGEYSAAAKIYLDELLHADTAFARRSLWNSLHTLFPYNGSSARLAEHLEEYFDTPGHALFVVNLVTNPVYQDQDERQAMAEVGKKAVAALLKRQELFSPGPDAEALALALMRAALYTGDLNAALTYAARIPAASQTAGSPEFNWMVASCHFLRREYAAAEAPLRRMSQSPTATERDRNAAAQALVGVYQQLGRRADQLHAAFLASQYMANDLQGFDSDWYREDRLIYWPYVGWVVDLPYLLDVQLTASQLRQYLKRYPQSRRLIVRKFPRERTAAEVVEYALAVRYARKERYERAAEIYQRLGAWPRATRMRQLARLYAQARNQRSGNTQRLQARYAYAVFLADHSTGVFFNDMLWGGLQTMAFMEQYRAGSPSSASEYHGLTRQQRESFLQRERQLRDEQEEYWRAYKLLASVVAQAGPSPLGERAARKALTCLRRIHTERFGRAEEIIRAEHNLTKWLMTHVKRTATTFP